MIAALEVHLTGGPSVLVELAGPAAIVIAAVAGAFFAARWASRNVSKELEAADRRQQERLAHDLLIRRVEHVRDALDDSAELALAAGAAVANFELVIENWEDERAALEAEIAAASSPVEGQALIERLGVGKDRVLAADSTVTARLTEMLGAKVRLQLRLGSSHAIPPLYEQLRAGWREAVDAFAKGSTRSRTEAEKKRSEELEDSNGDRFEEFFSECERWLASAPTFD
jgi:hypothetical protein